MDITQNPSLEDLQKVYEKYFSLRNLGKDITNKFALISLICWMYNRFKEKNPDVTYWQVVWKLGKESGASTDFLKGLAVVCSDFGYATSEYPTFNIPAKEIPNKIKDLLKEYLPF